MSEKRRRIPRGEYDQDYLKGRRAHQKGVRKTGRRVAAVMGVASALAFGTSEWVQGKDGPEAGEKGDKPTKTTPPGDKTPEPTEDDETSTDSTEAQVTQSGEFQVSEGETTGYVDLNSDTHADATPVSEQTGGGVSLPESQDTDTSTGGVQTP